MKLYAKSGSNVDVYSKAETNAFLSTEQNLISNGALTTPNITNLQTELNARPLSFSIYSKTEIETMISNIIDNSDVNLNTLNEIANAINNDPVFDQKVASIQGLETLVKPSDSFKHIITITKL
jgi:hypothetical protein